jgi:hypothetical protein
MVAQSSQNVKEELDELFHSMEKWIIFLLKKETKRKNR